MYFQNFPLIYYNFGDNEPAVLWQDLTVYIDLIDQLADQVSYYDTHHILDGDRPDNLSFKLYGDTQYYWTFYLLNPKLRTQGWPLAAQELEELAKKNYPHYTVTTKDQIAGSAFVPGAEVFGSRSATKGIIQEVNLELGQIIIDTAGYVTRQFDEIPLSVKIEDETQRKYIDLSDHDKWQSNFEPVNIALIFLTQPSLLKPRNSAGKFDVLNIVGNKLYLRLDENLEADITTVWATYTYRFFTKANFVAGETLLAGGDITTYTGITVNSSVVQYNSVHHYENTEGEWVDINPFSQFTLGLIPITYIERASEANDSLKTIKILRPDVVTQVANEFRILLKD